MIAGAEEYICILEKALCQKNVGCTDKIYEVAPMNHHLPVVARVFSGFLKMTDGMRKVAGSPLAELLPFAGSRVVGHCKMSVGHEEHAEGLFRTSPDSYLMQSHADCGLRAA